MTFCRIPQVDLADRIRNLLSGPPASDKAARIQRIYSMAARILSAAAGPAPLCLGCAAYEITAAALLAGLAGAPPLILPPEFSPPVLDAIHRATGFQAIIADPETIRQAPWPGIDPTLPLPVPPLQAYDGIKAPGDLWVYLYTGGSTGTPRLWSKTVANLLGEAAFQAARLALTPADVVLATVPAHHIYGLLFTVLAPLIAGAGVAPVTPVFPAEIAAALADATATILVSVPAHYRALLGHLSRGTALRLALSSAAPLPAEDAQAFFRTTGVPLEEVYGSTETGGIATRCRARGEVGLTPFAGLDWKIANGHLSVRSSFLSPELPRDAEGFFQTADRVSVHGKGGFVVEGRSDGVVKVGGRRVELETVRRCILAIRGVSDAFVFARPAPGGRQNEILALVQTGIEAAGIRSLLQAELPAWALPRVIRITDQIPLAATGKYDRQTIEVLFDSI